MWNESHSSPFFFSLSRLVADVDAFSLSLSLPDISSSYSDRPTLTYKREKVPTHTHTHTHIHILTQRLGHALIYNIQKMTQSCRLHTKGLDMQNLDTTHSDDRQLN
jgi:hypothetical protein